jgi:chromosome segregation ATPase
MEELTMQVQGERRTNCELSERLESLEVSANTAKARIEAELARARTDLKEARGDAEALRDELSKATAERNDAAGDAEALRAAMSRATADVNAARAEAETLRSGLSVASADLKQKEAEFAAALETECCIQKMAVARIESELDERTRRLARLDTSLASERASRVVAEERVAAVSRELSAKTAVIAEKERELIVVTTQARNASEQAKLHTQKEIAQKTAQVDALSAALASERERLEKHRQLHETAIADLQKQISTARATGGRAEAQLEQVRTALGVEKTADILAAITSVNRGTETLAMVEEIVQVGSDAQEIKETLQDMKRSREILHQFEQQFGSTQTLTRAAATSDPGFPLWYTKRLRRELHVCCAVLLVVTLLWLFRS